MANERGFSPRHLAVLDDREAPWLNLADEKLDGAVLDAYAWPHDRTDDQILERLLVLNLERANPAQHGIEKGRTDEEV